MCYGQLYFLLFFFYLNLWSLTFTNHLLSELRKCSKFLNMLLSRSKRGLAHWIILSPHYLEVWKKRIRVPPEAHLQQRVKVVPGRQVDLRMIDQLGSCFFQVFIFFSHFIQLNLIYLPVFLNSPKKNYWLTFFVNQTKYLTKYLLPPATYYLQIIIYDLSLNTFHLTVTPYNLPLTIYHKSLTNYHLIQNYSNQTFS